jgi:hypothetical protein
LKRIPKVSTMTKKTREGSSTRSGRNQTDREIPIDLDFVDDPSIRCRDPWPIVDRTSYSVRTQFVEVAGTPAAADSVADSDRVRTKNRERTPCTEVGQERRKSLGLRGVDRTKTKVRNRSTEVGGAEASKREKERAKLGRPRSSSSSNSGSDSKAAERIELRTG